MLIRQNSRADRGKAVVLGDQSNAAQRAGMILASKTSLDGLQVLVVEDSWHIASAIKAVIESAGMTVVGPAAALAEAEALLDEVASLDIAVVDVNLQGDFAYGLIEQLFERDIPVIIVSGYEALPAIADRAAAVLKKPVRASMLLQALKSVAQKRHAG